MIDNGMYDMEVKEGGAAVVDAYVNAPKVTTKGIILKTMRVIGILVLMIGIRLLRIQKT